MGTSSFRRLGVEQMENLFILSVAVFLSPHIQFGWERNDAVRFST